MEAEAHIKYFRCMKNSTGNLDISREYISKIKPAPKNSYGASKELKILKQKPTYQITILKI